MMAPIIMPSAGSDPFTPGSSYTIYNYIKRDFFFNSTKFIDLHEAKNNRYIMFKYHRVVYLKNTCIMVYF